MKDSMKAQTNECEPGQDCRKVVAKDEIRGSSQGMEEVELGTAFSYIALVARGFYMNYDVTSTQDESSSTANAKQWAPI